jgi:NTP pyrophosphatase (non-canonical NTP hydrolase)
MKKLDKIQQLMVITAEECGELTQVTSKILRKAKINDEWKQKLIEEAGDVYCMLDLIVKHTDINWKELEDRSIVKKKKLEKWSNLID